MTTKKELAEWLSQRASSYRATGDLVAADKLSAAARRLAVLEEEVEAWRNREDIPCHELCDGCRPDACESCHWASKISAARAATDKERANG